MYKANVKVTTVNVNIQLTRHESTEKIRHTLNAV